MIFEKWIEVHRIYRKCAIITWTQLGRCISMGTPIHSHYKKMNGKHRGRRIWKARGTAQLLRSTQNFCLLHHISPFYTLSVIFVQKVQYWLSYTPSKKILLTLSNKWMDSYGATHVYLQVVFCRVCNSVNTGLFAQKSLKGCRMDWCDVEDKRLCRSESLGCSTGLPNAPPPYVFHSFFLNGSDWEWIGVPILMTRHKKFK